MMRNVFLTGGSRGIGAAAVLALARAATTWPLPIMHTPKPPRP